MEKNDSKDFKGIEIILSHSGAKGNSKCTPEIAEAMSLLIMQGLTDKEACTFCNISIQSHKIWMNRGSSEFERSEADPESGISDMEFKYLNYYEIVSRALPRRKIVFVQQIEEAAKRGDWKAAAYLLEREYKEQYSKQTNVNHNHKAVVDTEVIALIASGIEFRIIEESLGTEEARRLFVAAGKSIPTDN